MLILLALLMGSAFDSCLAMGYKIPKPEYKIAGPPQYSPLDEWVYYSKEVTFSWEAYSGYPEYEIMIAPEPFFHTVVLHRFIQPRHEGGSSEFFRASAKIVIPLHSKRRYLLYWRIKVAKGDEAVWSRAIPFYVDLSPIPFCNSRRVEYGDPHVIRFFWEAVSGVDKYMFEIFKGAIGPTPPWRMQTVELTNPPTMGISEVSVELPREDFTPYQRYSWRVKAFRGPGGGWDVCCGGEFQFIPAAHPEVRLLSPPDGFVVRSSSALLSWSPLSGVGEYEVWWGEKGGHKVNKATTTETWISTGPVLRNGKSYWWKVKEKGVPWTGREEVRHFKVEIRPSMPVIVWPPSTWETVKTIIRKPQFKWEHERYATSYTLELRTGSYPGGSLIFRRVKDVPSVMGPVVMGTVGGGYGGRPIFSLDSPKVLSPGKYCFRIQACNRFGCSGWRTSEFEVIEPVERGTPLTPPTPKVLPRR